jgi:hypothetical protein
VATLTPAGVIASYTSPSIQISNNPSTGYASNLSGPAISGLEVFTGKGTEVHTSITGGVFFKF